MFCNNCGRELKDDWTTCPECGKAINIQHTTTNVTARAKIMPPKKKWLLIAIVFILGIGIIVPVIFISQKTEKINEKTMELNKVQQSRESVKTPTEPLPTTKQGSEQEDFSGADFEVLIGAAESKLEEVGLKKGGGEGIYVGLNGNIRVSCTNGNVDMISIQQVEETSPAFHTVRIGMSKEEASERLKKVYPEVEEISDGIRCSDTYTNEDLTCWITNDKVTRIHYTTLSEDQKAQDTPPQEQVADTEYIFPDSDKYYLSEDEVRTKSAQDLLIGRNEIFARHGYIFKMEELQEHFENTSWYHGTIPGDRFDMDSIFNAFEKKNVELIQKVEDEIDTPGSQEDESQTQTNETPQTLAFRLTVINNTETDIYHLYASKTDTDDWEEDILEDDILYDGESFDIIFHIDADSLEWDFAIQDEYENQKSFYDLSFADCDVDGATLVLWDEDGEIHASLY